jgi:membrane glycosyltransferase
MSSVAIRTLSVNEAIGDALKRWPTKFICERLKTSQRTVENWKQARTGPQAKHMAAMMNDDELCGALLTAMGRSDLATRAKMVAILKETRDALDEVRE